MKAGGFNRQWRWFGIAATPFPRISGGPWFTVSLLLRVGPRKTLL